VMVRVAAHADDAGTVSVCYNRPNQTQFMSNLCVRVGDFLEPWLLLVSLGIEGDWRRLSDMSENLQ
jgi:hypothetical protein